MSAQCTWNRLNKDYDEQVYDGIAIEDLGRQALDNILTLVTDIHKDRLESFNLLIGGNKSPKTAMLYTMTLNFEDRETREHVARLIEALYGPEHDYAARGSKL